MIEINDEMKLKAKGERERKIKHRYLIDQFNFFSNSIIRLEIKSKQKKKNIQEKYLFNQPERMAATVEIKWN